MDRKGGQGTPGSSGREFSAASRFGPTTDEGRRGICAVEIRRRSGSCVTLRLQQRPEAAPMKRAKGKVTILRWSVLSEPGMLLNAVALIVGFIATILWRAIRHEYTR